MSTSYLIYLNAKAIFETVHDKVNCAEIGNLPESLEHVRGLGYADITVRVIRDGFDGLVIGFTRAGFGLLNGAFLRRRAGSALGAAVGFFSGSTVFFVAAAETGRSAAAAPRLFNRVGVVRGLTCRPFRVADIRSAVFTAARIITLRAAGCGRCRVRFPVGLPGRRAGAAVRLSAGALHGAGNAFVSVVIFNRVKLDPLRFKHLCPDVQLIPGPYADQHFHEIEIRVKQR